MASNGKKWLFESFEDRKFAVAVGFLCLVYFALMYLSESRWIARILPFWPLSFFAVIGGITFVIEGMVWKAFKHFYENWYRNPLTYLLFICEFGLLLFTILFLSWPFFWIYRFFVASRTVL